MGERVISIEIPDEDEEIDILRAESDRKRKNLLKINTYFHVLVAIVCIAAMVLLIGETIKEIKYLDYILDHPEEDFLGLGAAFGPMIIMLLLCCSLSAFVFGPMLFIVSLLTPMNKDQKRIPGLVWVNLIMILMGSTVLLAGGIYALSYDLTYYGPSMLRDFKILFVGITGSSIILALLSGFHMIRIKRSLQREIMTINSRSFGGPLEL